MNMVYKLSKFPYIISENEDYILVRVFVQPNAKKDEYVGIHSEALKIRINAPAVDNKANKAVVLFLAKLFSIKKKDVVLVSGEMSRVKYIALYAESTHIFEVCTTLV